MADKHYTLKQLTEMEDAQFSAVIMFEIEKLKVRKESGNYLNHADATRLMTFNIATYQRLMNLKIKDDPKFSEEVVKHMVWVKLAD